MNSCAFFNRSLWFIAKRISGICWFGEGEEYSLAQLWHRAAVYAS